MEEEEDRVKRAARTGRRRSRKADGPHPVDIQVGARVRLRRNMLGLSQEKLGDARASRSLRWLMLAIGER
jgi:hypothetical protein